MGRKKSPKEAGITQEEPTQPRPRDEAGRELDEHGLPLSGPARLRALDGRPDPATQPAEVDDHPAAEGDATEQGA